ncbi:MAG: FKBP-type peptidyl-prolyl cis-trans isomerase [Muribaculaceae bacterium]|nr:FKBP-type peptidyl-prolyl cis-trans isomerase [Muribaculaceae bacterium]
MKKTLAGACVAFAAILASCSGEKAGSALPEELNDSISVAYGRASGSFSLSDVTNYNQGRESKVSKEDVLKGIRIALSQGNNDGVLIGMQIGNGMNNEMRRFAENGIDVDRTEVFNAFKEAFMADSIDMEQMRENHTAVNQLMQRASAIIEEAKKKEAEQAPDAQQNAVTGRAYVDKVKKSDPEVKTTASGLSYKIVEKGDSTAVTANSTVDVIYKGTHIDGSVFDDSNGNPVTFPVSGVQVPGFAEGLQMLGKGGKAVLYIPGELAYGPNGIPQAGIGPNEMLVFEVEVVDVK